MGEEAFSKNFNTSALHAEDRHNYLEISNHGLQREENSSSLFILPFVGLGKKFFLSS
jgi:hypothetical protein